MIRSDALPYVSFVVDESLAVRRLGADIHAVVRPDSWLIGWQCGFDILFVAVHSYLPGVALDADEAEELARDFLRERNWFAHPGGENEANYIIFPEASK